MTTPPLPPRPSVGRSSFAIAMKDYTFIRPGIAVTISAATLLAAVIIGVLLIGSLGRAARTVRQGGQTAQTLHRYNAALEVWRGMAVGGDSLLERPEARRMRDSIRTALTGNFSALQAGLEDATDSAMVRTILEGLATGDVELTSDARQAMIVLLARQDSAMFQAAATSQRAVLFSALLLGLTVLAAGMLVIPMAWLYVRYKRGAVIEVKV
ncbi:MAG TPA: hypothetical protein VD707_08910 [Gemmatimonadales bacterium]|jgi:hypothetical protein|nr:hypothetical protein [Gemmatimonadales bacterium]